jgi:sulfate/thiosulfate transport system permease protein
MSVMTENLKAAQSPPPASIARPWGRWGVRLVAISYLALMIVLPLSAIFERGLEDGITSFWSEITSPIAFAALKLTLMTAVITTAVNALMGTLTAYALVRYEFPGRGVLNGLVDMPFAIPTLVTGVMLVVLYGPQGTLGAWLEARGIQVIFATPGVVLALLLVTYPFVVRTVQPVLIEMRMDQEEAAYTIGASKWVTFYRIVLPAISPAIVTGALLTFARAIGEFGSIVIVAGNIPGRTLTAPVHVYGQIESQNVRGASAMSVLLLALSFTLMISIDWIQKRKETTNLPV